MENKNIFNKIFQYFETISDLLKSSNFLLFSDKVVILNLSLTRLKRTFKHIKIKFNICNWNSMHMDHWLIWVYLSFLITSIRCYLSYKKFLRAIIKPLKLQTGFLFVYMAVGFFLGGGGAGNWVWHFEAVLVKSASITEENYSLPDASVKHDVADLWVQTGSQSMGCCSSCLQGYAKKSPAHRHSCPSHRNHW